LFFREVESFAAVAFTQDVIDPIRSTSDAVVASAPSGNWPPRAEHLTGRSMSNFPRGAGHVDWLRDFLDRAREFFSLVAPSHPSEEMPAESTPKPGDRANAIEKPTDET